MTFLEKHPIATGVVEQRIREAIHAWVLRNRPDVAVEMRRVILQQLEDEDVSR
jgi:hypothetical protein